MPFEIDFDLAFAIDLSLAVFLWLVQCVIYPSFRHIRSDIFKDWHAGYQRCIAWIIGPLLLMQMSLISFEAIRDPDLHSLVRFAMVAICWLITACISVPLHRRIEREESRAQSIEQLIQSNWLRTVIWSSLFLSHFL